MRDDDNWQADFWVGFLSGMTTAWIAVFAAILWHVL